MSVSPSVCLCVCLPVCIACVWVVNPCICLSADCRISGSESRQPLLLLLTSCRYFSIYLSTRVAMKIGLPLLVFGIDIFCSAVFDERLAVRSISQDGMLY